MNILPAFVFFYFTAFPFFESLETCLGKNKSITLAGKRKYQLYEE